jgi:PAS domain S-box-containing protein
VKFSPHNDDFFRLAVESSTAAMILSDADGTIIFVNAETENIFGYSIDELLGKSIDILVPLPKRQGHASFRRNFYANPSKRPMGVNHELKARRRDGSEFPAEIGLTPIDAKEGLLVLATIVDVTERGRAEKALAQRAFELERANERLDQFAYVASHDLQEPLRKIAAYCELMEDAVVASNVQDALQANRVIRTSALRARALVDDLLVYSRTLNDEQQLQDLDLSEEIDAALNDVSELVNQTSSEIQLAVPHFRFRADRSQFARLIHNIVSNAIKYRKPNQPAIVRISADQPEPRVARLAIVDNGIGFEPKYATIIFEPFKRLHTSAVYPGTGIGLAICKSIVDRHGWALSIESQPGAGASFFISIPLLDKDPKS